mmetsp:Transcript_34499/g.108147  ORF Transcript_34499/g.108147 Transcript_34499/m.108147 type:complete len:354 (-) Transcript_34499:77-1138(-)
MPDFRVVSYNILCSSLAPADRFRNCKPENLDAAVRLPRILLKMEQEVEKEAIICLQEVGKFWSKELESFFQKRGYNYIHSGYGEAYNDFMGVGIAVPNNRFNLVQSDIRRVSSTKEWPNVQEVTRSTHWFHRVFSFFGKLLSTWMGFFLPFLRTSRSSTRDKCPWEVSRKRKNTCIFLRLSRKVSDAQQPPKTFCVANYHMPCVFWDQRVMVIHSALAARHVQSLSGADPYVFAGDFNIQPQSAAYRLLTSGRLEASHPDFPPDRAGDSWAPQLEERMESVYSSFHGSEPDFTNYAQIFEDPPFIETIDYIFCRPGMKVVGCLPLPRRQEVSGPLPNDQEPSDHIMIGADFNI